MASDDALIELVRRSAPERDPGSRLQVAFSGGLDSTVLLHAVVNAGLGDVVAVHVHHGLQAVADEWVVHCESTCRRLGVPLQVLRVQVRAQGQGLEAAARSARYEAFEASLRAGEVLVTAHHRGDQAETVLLNLMRGSGPAGLGGMESQRRFGRGWLWRPFLDTARKQLVQHAQRHGVGWIEDPHNMDPRFSRSFIRAEILPRLAQRWSSVEENLGRSARFAGESAMLLRDLADADLRVMPEGPDGSLPVASLCALSGPRRRNLIRRWVQGKGLRVPGHEALLHLDREVLGAAPDAMPVLAWFGGEFRRHREQLYVMSALPPVPSEFWAQWDGRTALELPAGCGVLEMHGTTVKPSSHWTVRMARPSDRFRPWRSPHSRTLKNLFQERGVPTWVRERTPLVAVDGTPVWVGGFGWCAGEEPAEIDIAWRHQLPGAPNGA